MVSFARIPNIQRGDLARQSLLLRLVLIPIFTLVTIWATPGITPAVVILALYCLSSALLAAGYLAHRFGSSDVIVWGMVDTNLALAAGALLTGGAASPVLLLFFGLQAAYFILATPRVFVIATAASAAAMIGSVSAAQLGLSPWQAGGGEYPWLYLLAGVGSLAMLGGVGWFHSLVFVGRSQANQHLSAALSSSQGFNGSYEETDQLAMLLDTLMTALHINDEGAIYKYDPQSNSLRRHLGMGLQPWFQMFPEFRPGEGIIGMAYSRKSRVISAGRDHLSQYLETLEAGNRKLLAEDSVPVGGPDYVLALPLVWGEEPVGALALARTGSGSPLDEREIQLAEALATSMAGAMAHSRLTRDLAEVSRATEIQGRLRPLLETLAIPGQGIQEFCDRLQELVPFDAIRIVARTQDGIQPLLGYFRCSGESTLDIETVDAYLDQELWKQARRASDLDAAAGSDRAPVAACAGSPERWAVSPELSLRGIASVLGTTTSLRNGQGDLWQGAVALLRRGEDAYQTSHVELVHGLALYIPALVALSATRSDWPGKARQVDSLREMVGLPESGGDKDRLAQACFRWVKDQLGSLEPVAIFILVSDEQKGSLKVSVGGSQFEQEYQSRTTAIPEALKPLLDGWSDPVARTLGASDLEALNLGELALENETAPVVAFPLRDLDKTCGLLGVQLPSGRELGPADRVSLEQFSGVAALCLENYRLFDEQGRQARELRHEDELRRSFISFVTHEFRTPLASLKTSFDLIRESVEVQSLAEPYQRLLVNINRSVGTLEQLINDLADVVNLTGGGVMLNLSPTSPESIVYPVIEMTAPLSHMKNQSLEMEILPGLPDILADSRRLEQVLTNMVSNAIKYTPAGGAIRAKVSRENGSVKFSVSDTGRGIAPEFLGQVFEPFFRVPGAPGDRNQPSGSGLGLALAKSLVELHGGDIWAECEPNQGCTFNFTIPVESRS